MRVRSVVLSVSIILGLAANAVTAESGERKKWRRQAAPTDRYYAGPGFVHRMPGFRLLFGDYALSEDEFNALYGEDVKQEEDRFDETYYEPKPLATAKPKPKPATKSTAKSVKPGSAEVTTATLGEAPDVPAAKKPLPAAKPSATTAEVPPPPKSAATAGLSCDKAGSIITGYGFSSVKPDSCKGKVYAFNATRDGRSFAIKVDAASGELTEVKKLN